MTRSISAQELRSLWVNDREVALLDVREEGPYADAHPLFALTVPVSEVEHKLPALVPRLSAPIVVYDDGEGYVDRAAARISALGYRDISILDGGLSAYARVGEVYRDVNVPSKAFGELVEAIRGTPSLPARDAKGVLDSDEDVVVLDARRFEEYHAMSIPCGRSCPGGELLYRLFEAAPSPDTTVLVHCAGRTRSLIGTQGLLNAGVPHRVVALRDGTIGWTLEGLELETGRTERVPPPSDEAVRKARQYAEAWARHVGVPIINATQLDQFVSEGETRTLYLLDVKDPEEYARGHPSGFLSAPGGQLVQATDEWVGVRGARIVLYDSDGVRARMAASWLVQLGWEVYVLEEESVVPDNLSIPRKPSLWQAPTSSSVTVDGLLNMEDATVVDLARSPVYRKGHIPGAYFASGPELAHDVTTCPGNGPIVLTSPDGIIAAANVEDARKAIPARDVLCLSGGTSAWVATGHPLGTSDTRWLSPPIDVYKRPYEGTDNASENMRAYIEWEHGLVAQLANDGVSRFRVARGKPTLESLG
jgi:rhodanese-related sulfurtransferase